MRKAGIQAATQRVTPSSDAVTTLVGDVAEYVKPSPKAAPTPRGTGGGRSQGANAQRKRAARTGDQPRSEQPRRDRSGRPARSGSGSGSGSGRPARTGNGTSGGSRPMYTSSSSAPTGNPRQANRRAQG